ncbi:MAG: hypothetical protein ABJH68_08160 [Ilumatobacter sp.]|uniref:hypothetical protein n=1 Tax=Ilumatobacter sp. TaxID=1967498 RepID=UPI003296D23F
MARSARSLTWPSVVLPGEVPAVMIGVAASIFLCVPETDQMDEVGVALGVVLVLELLARRPFGPAVVAVQAGVVLAAGLYGATSRDSATVGAWFSFWPFALTSLTLLVTHRLGDRVRVDSSRRILIEIVGVAAAIGVARTGAIQPTIGPAVAAVAVAVPVSIALAALVVLARRPTPS